MIIDFGKTQYASPADGFKNYSISNFTSSIGAQNLGAGAFVSATAVAPLILSGLIGQVMVNLGGLEAFWRPLNGDFVGKYGGGNYSVQVYYYTNGVALGVQTVVSNNTGGTVSIPAITTNCRGFLFLAPF